VGLQGRFLGPSSSPFLEGRLTLPRLGISNGVLFCIDTGADESVLMPRDARRLRVDADQLTVGGTGSGIGGDVRLYREHAVLEFTDPGVVRYVYDLRLNILTEARSLHVMPSLLGRDIINRWRIDYNPPEATLEIFPASADRTIDLTQL
jgi:hypothetical protein